MPVEKLKQFLSESGVRYETIPHSQAFTAQETAAAAHVPGRELAKTVMVRVDGELAMAVVPATARVSMDRLKRLAAAGAVELADEDDFRREFPGVEAGAMPPFGNLWGMKVYADRTLRDDEEIAFDAGTHTELVRLRYDDYERLVQPRVGDIAAHA